MDYFGIIKKAFKINLKNKFLWIFGILAGGAAGFNGMNGNFGSPSSNSTWSDMSKKFADFDITAFWADHGATIIFLTVLFTVLAIIFFVLNLTSQGALIGSVEKIEADEKVDFSKGFSIGWKNFWRVWALNITILLAILLGLCLLVIPTCLLVIAGAYVSATVIGILMFVVNLAFWIVISFISPYALRIVILRKLTIFQSLRQALHFVRDNLAEVVVIYLLLAAIGIAVGLGVAIAAVIIIGLLFAIGYGLFLASLTAAVFYGLIVAFILVLAIIAFSGAYSSFQSTVLTLTYLKLVNRN
ncbi:TPA: hypothetical protein DD449_00905 [Candidatus Berkelbacteria bacterium]|uniref:Glycerophosphoryl diester phosphodiesterase membrane domain-containing protein n=1 Tax=Berkelbacteria bacterium GW2011_GWE1_39_12 TaxID=1618337 RepID=A0A0G4B6N3_9BACT|nr:MAG: hypothetical protein UT28_C0001G0905 [Berkelbacteria bacterium GW2011_GWE1_39_12]HBO60231.1 hypothetical protein [Candidatus Berkelbacteria bacterium]